MKKNALRNKPMTIQGKRRPSFFENGAFRFVTYPITGSLMAFQRE
jgi:hypothetical protein